MKQVYLYDEDLSYHLLNLALVGEVQPIWETDDTKNPDLEDFSSVGPDGEAFFVITSLLSGE